MNNRSRHAYLIIAHSHPEIFKCLISALEDERNDIFCHIDKKANIDDFKKVIGGGKTFRLSTKELMSVGETYLRLRLK